MNILKKLGFFAPILAAGFLSLAGIASAHSVVSPKQANVGAFQTFSLGVPSEKAIATVGVRLVLPEGLNYVTPNVKQGWKIEVKKDGAGDGARISEISWTGEVIPSGQRDEFVFSAQVPAKATTLQWKVYQTYLDGSVVSWDHDPAEAQPKDANGKSDFSTSGPYSQTQIIDDLKPQVLPSSKPVSQNLPLVLSIIAIALALISFQRSGKKS